MFGHLRPISILPWLSKIFEGVLHRHLYEFKENYNILPEIQTGFRAGYSCSLSLTVIADDIMSTNIC